MLGRFSIRLRLTAWYSLSLALVLALLAVASYCAMRESMYRAVDVDLRYGLSGVEELLESQRSSTLDELPGEIAQQSTLGVLFRLFDDKGKLIYQSAPLADHHIGTAAQSVSGSTIVYRDLSGGWPLRLAARRVSFRGPTIIVEVAQPLRFHYASLREFERALLRAIAFSLERRIA